MNEMLSSCWFTSPFTGCFNAAIKGGVGSSSGMQDSAAAGSNVRVSQPPTTQSKRDAPIANGTAGISSSSRGHVTIAAGSGGAGSGDDNNEGSAGQQPRTPRKSKSMGRIHGGGSNAQADGGAGGAQQPSSVGGATTTEATTQQRSQPTQTTLAHCHRGHRRTPSDGVAWRTSKGLEAERERIIGGGEMLGGSDEKVSKRVYKSEYRKKFRPFSQYQYVDGKFQKSKDEPQHAENSANWYKEVIELRKQAGQYRARQDIGDVWRTVQHRGWGVETASDRLAEIYSKQAELWEQVSRRSSLQALSLASATPSTSRPISKAEKDIENSRRSSPIKHVSTSSRERPSTAPPKPKTTPKAADKTDGKSSKETTPRHHYDRTTGSEGRSVSVGPENRSPKRTSRPPSSHAPPPQVKPERRPRPTSLSTSARRKGTDGAPHHRPASHDENREAKKHKLKPHDPTASPKKGEKKQSSEENESKKDKEKEVVSKDTPKDIMKEAPPKEGPKDSIDAVKDTTGRKATPEPRFDPEKYEPVVKTPPEPTRVKSPDQAMVKSPDPVNWTVPLDTGKTFTVTHNIPEGDSARGTPSSEHGRHILDSGKRQTPEPTKINTGSLAGTPVSCTSDAKPSIPVENKSSVTKDSVESKSPVKESKPTKDSSIKTAETKSSDSKPSEPKPVDIKETVTKPIESKPKSPEPKVPDSKTAESTKPELSSVNESKTPEEPKTSMPESQQDKSLPPSDTHISPEIPMPLSSGTVDPMSMSMFGSLNGMNGNKSSGSPSPTKPEVPLTTPIINDSTKDSGSSEKSSAARNVPGTNLRCLDDPSFMFDSSNSSATKPQGGYKVLEAPSEAPPVKPSAGYRVLEAPETDSGSKIVPEKSPSKTVEPPVKPAPYRVLEAPMEPTTIPKGSPYRVLEAPDAPYYPQAQSVGAPVDSKPPSLVSPTSGRAVTEHLDKGRTRFDSFWGGPKDDPPSNV